PRPCRSLMSCWIASSRDGMCDLPPDGRRCAGYRAGQARIAPIIRGRQGEIRGKTCDFDRVTGGAGSAAAQALDERGQLGAAHAELAQRETGHLERELHLADDDHGRAELTEHGPLRLAVRSSDDRESRV